MPPFEKSIETTPFKLRKCLETRKNEVCTIRSKFPNKLPVIVERYIREKQLPLLDKTKFLVPHELTMGQFLCLLSSLVKYAYLLLQSLNHGGAFDMDRHCTDTIGDQSASKDGQRTRQAVFSSVERQLPKKFTAFWSKIALEASQSLYLLISGKSMCSMTACMAEVYSQHRDPDGFLYMTYASQDMFG